MTTNMIECGICQYHFSPLREHCPTCGAIPNRHGGNIHAIRLPDNVSHIFAYRTIVVAHGAERARQLPQNPRFFQLVD